jgi:hypothetical protein
MGPGVERRLFSFSIISFIDSYLLDIAIQCIILVCIFSLNRLKRIDDGIHYNIRIFYRRHMDDFVII